MAQAAERVQLKEATLGAFAEYIREAETDMEHTIRDGPFLWSEASADRAPQLARGRVLAELWSGKRPIHVPDGLIHDWVGAVRIPGATVAHVLLTIQDYDNHKDLYRPEVIGSRLLSHNGDRFQVYLRLLKKKILTVVLDTDHDVLYASVDPKRWICNSRTTRIAEVDNAGKPSEKAHAADAGYGFLWRLYSYWRFEQREDGVEVECRAISLSRDMPKGLAWIIEPIIAKLPRESLMRTLESTRRGVAAGAADLAADGAGEPTD